jgi:plasmid stability protein
MTELTIHAIPDETFIAFAAHASRRGHSIEGAVLELIHAAANEETLMQALAKASQAAEDIDILVPTEPGVTPRPRRRYRSVKPTPIGRRR